MLRNMRYIPYIAAAASAVLLRLALPPAASADVAFFALAPLMLALRAAPSARAGFRLGMAFGLLFRLLSLSWLLALRDNGGPFPLVFFGWLVLSAYTALFSGAWGWLVATLWRTSRREGLPHPLLFQCVAWISEPLLWAGSEHLVATVLTGFPWNPVAATQAANPPLLSVAAIGGATMLSALIVAVNSGTASLLRRIWADAIAPRFAPAGQAQARPRSRVPRTLPLFVSLAFLIAAWWHGIDRSRQILRRNGTAPRFRIAVVHPDAPCIFERDDASVAAANDALLSFTELASATGPDLVIWPETSLPGYIPYDREAAALVGEACKTSGAPLVAGGVEYRPRFRGDKNGLIFNSAFLFSDAFSIKAAYRKRHLVPFGEYIPFESRIPALKRLAPTGFSCEEGTGPELFGIANKSATTNNVAASFAPLICFEDAFPYLARESALAGASAIVTIANDAWFDGTSEAEQHLAQAVLRAAETGLPVIRAANRGVSAFILPDGRVLRRLGDGSGSGSPGFVTAEIGIVPEPGVTTYVKYGDAIFAMPCAGYFAGLLAAALLIGRMRAKRRRAVSAQGRESACPSCT